MLQKKYLVGSIILHGILCALLLGVLPVKKPTSRHLPLEAKLMFKKKPRPEHWLPDKVPAMKKKTAEESPQPTPKPVEEAARPQKKEKKATEPPKKTDYLKELARLSKSFSEELDNAVDAKEVIEDLSADGSYFDQVYSLVKRSFVVPPHVNGPRGRFLQAVLRVYIGPKGDLLRLTLERSSGDEHFDKAVMEGTQRVDNFGAVPLMLQSVLSEDGIVIEMCPFKCAQRRDG